MGIDVRIADEVRYLQQTLQFTVRMRQLREEYGITQGELAERLGITRKKWNDYEIVRVRVPYQILLAVSDIFGVSLDYLFGMTDVRERYPAPDDSSGRTEPISLPPETFQKIRKSLDDLSGTLAALKAEHTEVIDSIIDQVREIESKL